MSEGDHVDDGVGVGLGDPAVEAQVDSEPEEPLIAEAEELLLEPEDVPAGIAERVPEEISLNSGKVESSADKLKKVLARLNGQANGDISTIGQRIATAASPLRIPKEDAAYWKDISENRSGLEFGDELGRFIMANLIGGETGDVDIKVALTRAQAVSCGWLTRHSHVVLVTDAQDADTAMLDRLANAVDEDWFGNTLVAAKLVPYFAEYVFRTTGHHYLSADAQAYTAKYNKLAAACLVADNLTFLEPSIMYHKALHWVSPQDAHERAARGDDDVPNAIKIRINAYPAGTAIVSVAKEIYGVMCSDGYEAVLQKEAAALGLAIRNASGYIEADPLKYHIYPHAYGRSPATGSVKDTVTNCKAVITKYAWLFAGYVSGVLGNSSLAGAQTIAKAAEDAPTKAKRARAFFRAKARDSTDTFASLFKVDNADVAEVDGFNETEQLLHNASTWVRKRGILPSDILKALKKVLGLRMTATYVESKLGLAAKDVFSVEELVELRGAAGGRGGGRGV